MKVGSTQNVAFFFHPYHPVCHVHDDLCHLSASLGNLQLRIFRNSPLVQHQHREDGLKSMGPLEYWQLVGQVSRLFFPIKQIRHRDHLLLISFAIVCRNITGPSKAFSRSEMSEKSDEQSLSASFESLLASILLRRAVRRKKKQ